jgi:hypothetical protein
MHIPNHYKLRYCQKFSKYADKIKNGLVKSDPPYGPSKQIGNKQIKYRSGILFIKFSLYPLKRKIIDINITKDVYL